MAENDREAKVARAVSTILIVQAVVSGLVALAIIVGAIYLAFTQGQGEKALELLTSWGGVVIGFYFGTAYSQIANLVRAIDGQPASQNDQDAPPTK